MAATRKLTGFKELDRKLRKLPEKVHKKVMRQSVRAASKPMVKTARAKVPRRTGQLRKSLGVKVKRYGGTFVAILGPRSGFSGEHEGRSVDPVKYAHLVELGVAPHAIVPRTVGGLLYVDGVWLPRVEHPGLEPTGFFQKAFDTQKGAALAAMKKKLRDGITREAKKKG